MRRTRKRITSKKQTRGLKKKGTNIVWPRLMGRSLVFIGVVLLAIPFVLHNATGATSPEAAATQQMESTSATIGTEHIKIDESLITQKTSTQIPLRILVPGRSVDIPIVEAAITNGSWEISETTASHGMGSSFPGEVGNTVIFAHAREGLFLPLREIKKDEDVYILTPQKWFRYRVVDTKLVTPDQIEVIKPTTDETLTLFTCSGFLDSKRLIVIAKPLYP